MLRTVVIVWLSALSVMAADPAVTVSSLNEDGVTLFSYDAPEFSVTAAPFASIKARAALLPYAVLLKNGTDHDIIAYSVRWTPIGTDGLPAKPQLLTPRNFRGGAVVRAGASALVSFVDGVTLPLEAQSAALDRRMVQAATYYRAQQSVEISLELVVFDDGNAVGPDRDGKLSTLRAWIDAERDFSMGARDLKDPEAFSSWVRQTRDQGFESLSPELSRTINSLLLAAEMSSDYAVAYRFARSYFAALWADAINQTDAKSTHERLISIAASKLYPVIHRRKGAQ